MSSPNLCNCENPPSLSSISSGSGSIIELGGLECYVTGPSDSRLAIILASDAYGYDAPNLSSMCLREQLKIADKVAAAGFYVVVPDFLHGEPYDPDSTERPLPVWLSRHGPDKAFEDAVRIISALRSKGISAIGAAGYCWGAKVAVDLAKSDHIQAAVLLHASLVTLDDIKEVKVSTSILGAEIDKWTPPELCKQFEEVLCSKSEIKSYVKIFPGVVHGWALRYKVEDKKAVKDAEVALQNMLDWFIEYVKVT
ncbi:hypothetical protein LguiA_011458 [Lonicera macranthoides]